MEEILNLKKRIKRRHLLLGFFILVFLFVVGDILFLFFGGPFLAQQLILPLPQDSIKSDTPRCWSYHIYACKNTDYLTAISPQDVAAQWSLQTEEKRLHDGRIYYEFTECNESWLGLHYSSIYQYKACVIMGAYYDSDLKMTRIQVHTKWPVCPGVVGKYANGFFNQYFKCDPG